MFVCGGKLDPISVILFCRLLMSWIEIDSSDFETTFWLVIAYSKCWQRFWVIGFSSGIVILFALLLNVIVILYIDTRPKVVT